MTISRAVGAGVATCIVSLCIASIGSAEESGCSERLARGREGMTTFLDAHGRGPAARDALQAARDVLLEARATCPDSAEDLLVLTESRLGYLHHREGHFEAACSVLSHLLELRSDRLLDRALYADALEQSGRFQEAVDECEKLIRAEPRNPAFYCNKAMICALRLKDGPRAVEVARRGSEMAPAPDPCLTYAWGKGLEVWGVDMLDSGHVDQGLDLFKEARGKFSAVLEDPEFGLRAKEDLARLERWIDRRSEGKETREKR